MPPVYDEFVGPYGMWGYAYDARLGDVATTSPWPPTMTPRNLRDYTHPYYARYYLENRGVRQMWRRG